MAGEVGICEVHQILCIRNVYKVQSVQGSLSPYFIHAFCLNLSSVLIICYDNPPFIVSYVFGNLRYILDSQRQVPLIDIGDICLRICQLLSFRSMYLGKKRSSLGNTYFPLTRSTLSLRRSFADYFLELFSQNVLMQSSGQIISAGLRAQMVLQCNGQ